MDEDVVVRAIAIGASLLMTVTVFAIVMNYYSSAKELGNKVDYEVEKYYSSRIQDILYDDSIDGEDAKNLINYYYKSNSVIISLNNVKIAEGSSIKTLDHCSNANMFFNDAVTTSYIQDELNFKKVWFNLIMDQKFTLSKETLNSGIVVYTLSGK